MNTQTPFVVIVDDVHDNVRILHHCLKDEGYSFAVARNAGELFQLLDARTPTLVLLDVMLPDMDGFSAAARIRADPRFSDLPIIFVTARAERDDRLRGFSLGGVDYVTKPFDAAEVRERVRIHIALRQAMEEQRRLNQELQAALDRVKTLEGIIPICAKCKKVREDDGFWTQVEKYIADHTGALFSHGLCPDCAREYFPQELFYPETGDARKS
jgi:CheY-like chemotaxis protein